MFEAQATDRLLQMIDHHYSSEGVHLEHSPEYHSSVTPCDLHTGPKQTFRAGFHLFKGTRSE